MQQVVAVPDASTPVCTLGQSERYNPIMLALQILPNGDPVFATFAGVMHLKLGRQSL